MTSLGGYDTRTYNIKHVIMAQRNRETTTLG